MEIKKIIKSVGLEIIYLAVAIVFLNSSKHCIGDCYNNLYNIHKQSDFESYYDNHICAYSGKLYIVTELNIVNSSNLWCFSEQVSPRTEIRYADKRWNGTKIKSDFIVEENKKDYNGIGEQVEGEKGYEGMA